MYHKIKDKVENTEDDQSMSVSTANFEAQLKALIEAGYTPINFKQLKMNALDKTNVFYEIQKSFGDIEKYLGKRDVKVLAYPQSLHTSKVKEWANESGVDLQVTNLVSKYRPVATQKLDIKRIHVSNELSPKDLLNQIKYVTQ